MPRATTSTSSSHRMRWGLRRTRAETAKRGPLPKIGRTAGFFGGDDVADHLGGVVNYFFANRSDPKDQFALPQGFVVQVANGSNLIA